MDEKKSHPCYSSLSFLYLPPATVRVLIGWSGLLAAVVLNERGANAVPLHVLLQGIMIPDFFLFCRLSGKKEKKSPQKTKHKNNII
jgi:hypothetical protein